MTRCTWGKISTASGPRFHGNHNRNLAPSTTAAFAGLSLAAERGVMHLDRSLQAVARISVLHGFANLMTPCPGHLIRNAQIILELTSRTSCASGGHKKNSPEPVSQWFTRLVKDRMRGNRCLMPAGSALIQFAGFNQ